MKESELKTHIKNGASGGYLFFGDEDYTKSRYAAMLRDSVVSGDFAAYNSSVIEGTDYSPDFLIDTATSAPFMSDKKFVMLRDLSFSLLREKGTELFLSVLEKISHIDYTVFVLYMSNDILDYGILPKRPSAIYSSLTKYLKPVQFDSPTPARLRKWIERHFAQDKISITPNAVNRIIEKCGCDMWILSGEVEKLCVYALANKKDSVDIPDIDYVTCRTLADDAFAIANAVLEGNRARALDALHIHKLRKEEPIAVLSSISRVWCDLLRIKTLADTGLGIGEISSKLKMHEYRTGLYYKEAVRYPREKLENSVALCREADLLIKSTSLGFIAIERLIAQTN